MVVEYDGVETTVIDLETKTPLSDAFVYASFEGYPLVPHVLARSNEQGELTLKPKRRLEFVILMGEGNIDIPLWVCKEGYKPYQVGDRGGWNADFSPAKIYRTPVVALEKSPLPPEKSCSPDVEFR
jgi:hypothetical protein